MYFGGRVVRIVRKKMKCTSKKKKKKNFCERFLVFFFFFVRSRSSPSSQRVAHLCERERRVKGGGGVCVSGACAWITRTLPKPSWSSGHFGSGRVVFCSFSLANCRASAGETGLVAVAVVEERKGKHVSVVGGERDKGIKKRVAGASR